MANELKDGTTPLPFAETLAAALRHYQAREFGQSEVLCEQVLNLDKDNPDALFMLGLIASQEQKYSRAIEYLSRAVALNPGNISYQVSLGDALYSLGMIAAASDAYQAALQINPAVAILHYAYAQSLYESGNTEAAIAEFQRAIELQPDLHKAYYGLGVALFNEHGPGPSESAMEKALQHNPDMIFARFGAAIIEDLLHRDDEARYHFKQLSHLPWLQDCWDYVRKARCSDTRLFASTFETLRYGMTAAQEDGLILEFGVRAGTSIRFLASLTDQEIHGFDSFEGLPEPWENMPGGVYSFDGRLPEVPEHVELHAGWFEETLPQFVAEHKGPIRFINMDCDIYRSTETVFDYVGDRIVEGTVIVFDEYLMNPHWREDEYKAFQEAVEKYSWGYEYLAFSLFSKQAVVRITA